LYHIDTKALENVGMTLNQGNGVYHCHKPGLFGTNSYGHFYDTKTPPRLPRLWRAVNVSIQFLYPFPETYIYQSIYFLKIGIWYHHFTKQKKYDV
jgi:hypothetical protein